MVRTSPTKVSVFIDANILFSAFIGTGSSREILVGPDLGKCELLISPCCNKGIVHIRAHLCAKGETDWQCWDSQFQ